MQRHWLLANPAGEMMQPAFEAFAIEVGLYGNVFSHDYEKYARLSTDGTWFKNFWETASHLRIDIALREDVHIRPVRERDGSITEALVRAGYSGLDLELLGTVRKHKCLIHLSDLTYCDGVTIDQEIFSRRRGRSAKHQFPYERPSAKAFRLW